MERLRHLRELLQLVDAAPSTPPPPAPAGHDALERRGQELESLVNSLEVRLADR